MADPATETKMQGEIQVFFFLLTLTFLLVTLDSWVEVQEQNEGKLAHPSSKEELKHMLASAASEEEEELSDTDVV